MEDCYGFNRVEYPPKALPQSATRLNNNFDKINDHEILIEVTKLNIDSASFHQLKLESLNDSNLLKKKILDIVNKKGKMHNPVTNSGGMLIGKVLSYGIGCENITLGINIATLVSLTLTPLYLEKIHNIDMVTGQITVTGKAILFSSGPYAALPFDMSENVALAALDVCGAPAQVKRLVNKNDTVVVLGAGGKSGLLSLVSAKQNSNGSTKIIAIEENSQARNDIEQLKVADHILGVDATNAVELYETVSHITKGQLADLTINCLNVKNSEAASILVTKSGGTICFFSTAIMFTQAALGAEGMGKDVTMLIGNGYVPGHANYTLELLRSYPNLFNIFKKRYDR